MLISDKPDFDLIAVRKYYPARCFNKTWEFIETSIVHSKRNVHGADKHGFGLSEKALCRKIYPLGTGRSRECIVFWGRLILRGDMPKSL
jgi:hypothetical protein